MLSLFGCVIRVSLESLEETKLISIFNWIFHSPWVLCLSIKSFRYGSILWRQFSVHGDLLLSPLLSYSMSLLLKALPVLIGL